MANASLKLLIDTKRRKVLFAEGGKDVVDFLFSILNLPASIITRHVTKEAMMGTLGNLYQSVEDLDGSYMDCDKTTLLSPTILYSFTNASDFVTYVVTAAHAYPPSVKYAAAAANLGYVKNGVKYMKMDDLTVKPVDATSIIDALHEFNVKKGEFEEKQVSLSKNNADKLVKAAFLTKAVLTHVFIDLEDQK